MGGYVLDEDISYRRILLWMNYKYYKENMSYLRTFITGNYVLLEKVSHGSKGLMENMSY